MKHKLKKGLVVGIICLLMLVFTPVATSSDECSKIAYEKRMNGQKHIENFE